MDAIHSETKVLLLGGTSHSGKTTLAAGLAGRLGWRHVSADRLSRHPGRPWSNDGASLPDDVIEHFSRLSPEELLEDVMSHYRGNVWPIVDAIVRSHVRNSFDRGLVLEGSAILPELYESSSLPDACSAIWLRISKPDLRERILLSSRFETRRLDEQELIEAFFDRAVRFNSTIAEAAVARGYACIGSASFEMDEVVSALGVRTDVDGV